MPSLSPLLPLFLIFGSTHSFNPLSILNYGFGSSTSSSEQSYVPSDQNQQRRYSDSDEGVQILYGKPIKDKSSVLDSLFELNAQEIVEYKNPVNSNVKSKNVFTESNEISTKENELKTNEISNIFYDLNFLPLVKNKNNTHQHFVLDEDLLRYLDTLREDAWTHFKSIILSYISTLDSPTPDGFQASKTLPVQMFLKLLDMGDNINILHLIGKKVDPNIAEFLLEKLKSSSPAILGLDNITEDNVADMIPTFNELIHKFAWMSLRHIIDDLTIRVNETVSPGELESYVSELETTNKFAAKGLKFILNLPSKIPNYDEQGSGRSFSVQRKLRVSDREGGYGHQDDFYHDDYGHKDIGYGNYGSHDGGSYGGGGYHSMGIKLDPYLILAGIGTAALLAFVAFRVLVTEPAERRKRSIDLDSSDYVGHILTALDEGTDKFEVSTDSEIEDMIESVNHVWRNRISEECLKCSLYKNFQERNSNQTNLKHFLLSVFGLLLGEKTASKVLDKATENLLNGKESKCELMKSSCPL